MLAAGMAGLFNLGGSDGHSWRLTVLVPRSLVVSGDGVFFVFVGLSFSLLVVPLLVL